MVLRLPKPALWRMGCWPAVCSRHSCFVCGILAAMLRFSCFLQLQGGLQGGKQQRVDG